MPQDNGEHSEAHDMTLESSNQHVVIYRHTERGSGWGVGWTINSSIITKLHSKQMNKKKKCLLFTIYSTSIDYFVRDRFMPLSLNILISGIRTENIRVDVGREVYKQQASSTHMTHS